MVHRSPEVTEARLPWLLWIFALPACAVAAWLAWMKLSGRVSSIVGCGEASGCASVLGGRWSEWLHLPVALLAALLYAVILVASVPYVQRRLQTGVILSSAALLILLSIAWFCGLMAVLRAFCPWCLAIHGLGLIVCTIILRYEWDHRQECPGLLAKTLYGAIAAMAVLVLGQLFGPQPATFAITRESMASPVAAQPAPGAPRILSYFGGNLQYDPRTLPITGSPEAPCIIVEYFDYTCKSCRQLHGDLKALKNKFPGKYAIILLPVPLHRRCNPSMKPGMPDHESACELATLAMAVWQTKKEAFSDWHDYVMTTSPDYAPALAKASSLCGPSLTTTLTSPSHATALQQHITVFSRLIESSKAMPKLLLSKDQVMHGLTPDAATFISTIEQNFNQR